MTRFLVAGLFLVSLTSAAQRNVTFSSRNYVGLLEGEQGSKFQLQTINGMKYQSWFVGVGTGIDWYFRRSIPAFISVNKDFFKKGNRNFFVAADAGINFPWRDDKSYNAWGYMIEKSLPGFYGSAGLGYKIGIGKNNDALLLQVGYSFKHIEEKAKNYNYYPYPYYSYYSSTIIVPQPEAITNRFDYYLRTLSLKVGWNF